MYELPGLSYREFLWFNETVKLNPVLMDDLLAGDFNYSKYVPPEFKPLQNFGDYLRNGYYPFFKEDLDNYLLKLKQMVRSIVEYAMAELKDFDIRNSKKLLQLLYIIAQQVPFKPNISKLAEKTNIHRNTLPNYFYFLEQAKLLMYLFPEGKSIALLQKPEKLLQIEKNYADLKAFNAQNILLSLNRAKDAHEIETIRKLYGL